MSIVETLSTITNQGASDIFIVAGRELTYKMNGRMFTMGESRLMPADCAKLISEI